MRLRRRKDKPDEGAEPVVRDAEGDPVEDPTVSGILPPLDAGAAHGAGGRSAAASRRRLPELAPEAPDRGGARSPCRRPRARAAAEVPAPEPAAGPRAGAGSRSRSPSPIPSRPCPSPSREPVVAEPEPPAPEPVPAAPERRELRVRRARARRRPRRRPRGAAVPNCSSAPPSSAAWPSPSS